MEINVNNESKLIDLGFKVSNKGFNYILYAVQLIQDSHFKHVKMMGLYAEIAKIYGAVSQGSIERGIRHEVETYYDNVDPSNIPSILKPDSSGKLNNKEFLYRMAKYLYSN